MNVQNHSLRSKLNYLCFESKKGLCFILFLSLALKFGLRLMLIRNINFWESGYGFYYQLALNFLQTGKLYLHGHGLYSADFLYAVRPPLYPLFIAVIAKLSGFSVPIFIFFEALISTFTVIIVYQLATRCFDSKTGFLSALFYAFFPYALFHDTQLQENVLYNFFSTLSIWYLIRGIDQKKNLDYFLGGIVLGAATLTRASHIFHSLFLILLFFYLFRKNFKHALKVTSIIILGITLVLSPWLIRNKRILGTFTITTLTGDALSEAHNPFTFSYYPYKGAVDQGSALFQVYLENTRKAELENLPNDEMAQNRWYQKLALDYISKHKVQTLIRGIQKIAINFLGILSPQQDPIKNWSYFISYWFLTLMTLFGIQRLKQTIFFHFFITLCLSQALFSFLFWAHSSHRNFLDPILTIAGASGVTFLLSKLSTNRNVIGTSG